MDRQNTTPVVKGSSIAVDSGPPLLRLLISLLLLITLLCLFVPFYPVMPRPGLDPSWAYGLNQAVAQGLAFGRDIIFTFGPYASLYTGAYHPATAHLMMAGSIFLSVAYWLAVVMVMRGVPWYFLLVLLVVLGSFIPFRDPLLFSYPLLVGQSLLSLPEPDSGSASRGKSRILITAFLMAPFALLPLIKGSSLVLCAAVAGLIIIRMLMLRQWLLALVVIVIPTISLPLFWIGAGQPLDALPDYFANMLAIVNGYSDAMSLNGDMKKVFLYVVSAVSLLFVILRQKQQPVQVRCFIFLLYAVYLFLAFKSGFVRHDAHDLTAAAALLLGATVLLSVNTGLSTILVFLLSSGVCLLIGIHSYGIYSITLHGLKERITHNGWPRTLFETRVGKIAHESFFPGLAGSVDIYSYNQTLLIASGNKWDPRPIFQSYSAYTPALAAANREHLVGKRSPDNIVFRVEPIDGRLPSLEDGDSWPVLLTRYRRTFYRGGFLFLRKSQSTKRSVMRVLQKGRYSLGETIPIDHPGRLLFARVALESTLPGKLIGLLYKPSQLQITLHLIGGQTRSYRFVAEMGRSEFLLSPLVERTSEFALLYDGVRQLVGKEVVSFSITSAAGPWEWKQPFSVIIEGLSPGNAQAG